MNIYEAIHKARELEQEGIEIFLKNPSYTWTLFLAPGTVFRDLEYGEIELEARACASDKWYLIDGEGKFSPWR